MGRLDGQVAIVTGGGQGIGAAISSRFAQEGACVVIAQRTTRVAERHAASIRAVGGQAIAVRTDVTSRADIEAKLLKQSATLYKPENIHHELLTDDKAGKAAIRQPHPGTVGCKLVRPEAEYQQPQDYPAHGPLEGRPVDPVEEQGPRADADQHRRNQAHDQPPVDVVPVGPGRHQVADQEHDEHHSGRILGCHHLRGEIISK